MSQTSVLTELPAVARSISLHCNNCEAERFFKVVAHIGDVAAKTKCEVCGRSKTLKIGESNEGESMSDSGEDKSKSAKGKKPRNTAGMQAAAEKRRTAAAERKAEAAAKKDADAKADYVRQYESLKQQIGVATVQSYGMKGKFLVANAIQHPTFGLGFVTVATGDRIEVAFESGVRQLIHNRP